MKRDAHKVPNQAKAKRDCVINPLNNNFIFSHFNTENVDALIHYESTGDGYKPRIFLQFVSTTPRSGQITTCTQDFSHIATWKQEPTATETNCVICSCASQEILTTIERSLFQLCPLLGTKKIIKQNIWSLLRRRYTYIKCRALEFEKIIKVNRQSR